MILRYKDFVNEERMTKSTEAKFDDLNKIKQAVDDDININIEKIKAKKAELAKKVETNIVDITSIPGAVYNNEIQYKKVYLESLDKYDKPVTGLALSSEGLKVKRGSGPYFDIKDLPDYIRGIIYEYLGY